MDTTLVCVCVDVCVRMSVPPVRKVLPVGAGSLINCPKLLRSLKSIRSGRRSHHTQSRGQVAGVARDGDGDGDGGGGSVDGQTVRMRMRATFKRPHWLTHRGRSWARDDVDDGSKLSKSPSASPSPSPSSPSPAVCRRGRSALAVVAAVIVVVVVADVVVAVVSFVLCRQRLMLFAAFIKLLFTFITKRVGRMANWCDISICDAWRDSCGVAHRETDRERGPDRRTDNSQRDRQTAADTYKYRMRCRYTWTSKHSDQPFANKIGSKINRKTQSRKRNRERERGNGGRGVSERERFDFKALFVSLGGRAILFINKRQLKCFCFGKRSRDSPCCLLLPT